jgi:hypothetical protein
MQEETTGFNFPDVGYRRAYSSGNVVEFEADQFAHHYYWLCVGYGKC